jgi:glyoxylase-like metal-dependent hydrolase (beta-lactamase superfamily II)/rhodanese-related sulfurtransferase
MSDSPAIEEVTAEELYQQLRRGEPLFILDVRNEEEFSHWRIEGLPPSALVNMPYFAFLEDEQGCLEQIPRARNVTVVCAQGGSSAFIAAILAHQGIHSRNLQGGMVAWGNSHVTTTISSPDESGLTLLQINRVGKRCLSYIVASGSAAMIIDPSRHLERYRILVKEQQTTLTHVIDTHLHADHISGGPEMARLFGVPYHIRLDDAARAKFPYHSLDDGTRLALGSSVVEIIAVHTPGHTPGSTSLLINEKYLLTGDTLFVSSIGRPDLGHKAEEWARQLYRTLFERMASLPDDVLILPAHYAGAAEMRRDGVVGITLGEARLRNPAFQVRTEPEFLDYVLEHLAPQPSVYQEIRRVNLGQMLFDEEHALEAELGPNQCAASLPPRS